MAPGRLEPTFQNKREFSEGLAQVWRRQQGRIHRSHRPDRDPADIRSARHQSRFCGTEMPASAKLGRPSRAHRPVGTLGASNQAYDSIYPYYGGETRRNSDFEFKGFFAKRGPMTDILDRIGQGADRRHEALARLVRRAERRSRGGMHVHVGTPGQYPMFCDDGRIIGFFDHKPRLFERDGTPLEPARANCGGRSPANRPMSSRSAAASCTSINGCGR